MIHVYYGDGKGKTTAAVGLAARAAGAGLKVLFCQFLKGLPTGELNSLHRLEIQVIRSPVPLKFTNQMNDAEKEACRKNQLECLARVQAQRGEFDLVVLDEALDLAACGFWRQDELLAFVKEFPAEKELVLTGRDPDARLLKKADYVTRFQKEKHPYDQGSLARKGIEF